MTAIHTSKAGAVVLVSTVAMLAALPADAALIERDLLTRGDGLITFDTATGLQWLDLTETTGLDPVEAVAVFSDLRDAGAFSGRRFRWASDVQVNSLLAAFGLPEKAGGPFTSTIVTLADAERFLDFLGVTEPADPSGLNGPASKGHYDDGLADDLQRFIQVDLTEPPPLGTVAVPTVANNRFAFPCDDCIATSTHGVFLVRAIPEPTSAVVFTVGLMVVARRLRSLR